MDDPGAQALPVLGWREWVQFPDLHLGSLKAKCDTGARTSALHASDITLGEREGIAVVSFRLHPRHKRPHMTRKAVAPVVAERWVKSSSGHQELRPVITAMIQIGEDRWPIELTLSARHDMGFRLLLGREAFRGRYLIDPGHSYLRGIRIIASPTPRAPRSADT